MAIYRIKRFSWFDKLRDWADKANKKIDPSYKTEEEIHQERLQKYRLEEKREQEILYKKASSISRQHRIIADIINKVCKFTPTWGDGDEYPTLFIKDYDERRDDFGNIRLGLNHPEYHWNGKYWVDITDRNRKVYNLKQDMLKFLKSERKQWEKVDYLDEGDIREVLVYLDKLIGEISKSSL